MAEKGQITQFVLLMDGQLNAFNKLEFQYIYKQKMSIKYFIQF